MTSASILGVGLCLLTAGSQTANIPGSGALTGDVIVAGVHQGDGGVPTPFAAVQVPGSMAAGSVAIAIDFDDVAAPCVFAEAKALRGEYAAQGAIFWGTGPSDGGAVLDACGGFGVSGYSAPNFLAFNSFATYPGGGAPSAPEFIRLLLPNPVQHIELRAGSGQVGTLTLTGVRADGVHVASSQITLGPALQTVAVDAEGMVGAIVTSTAGVFVVDDLAAH